MSRYDGDIDDTRLIKIYHLPRRSGARLLLSSDCITTSINMLGTDLMGPVDISPSPNFALFKSHKTFPRRKAQTDARTLSHSFGLKQSQVHEDQDSYKSSQRIRSWIPEPSAPHVAPDHVLPLTPPINMQDHEEERWAEERIHANGKLSSQQKSSDRGGMSTPIIQHRPLTPETTPPRSNNVIRPLDPPLTSRDPSLRTESFETARETLSVDGSLSVESPSMPPARRPWFKQVEHAKSRDFGLGLDLESEDDDPTPTEIKPKYSLKKYDFNNGNTVWSEEGGTANDLGLKTGDDDVASGDLRLKKLRNRQRMPSHPLPRGLKTDEETASLVPRALSLRQRVEKCQQNLSPSTERFAEQIDWPLRGEAIDIDNKLREVDLRRFSQASASSTVVEAMVIDTPPQRRKTLRHTGKIPTTYSDNAQAVHSNRSSLISTGSVRRRLPRNSVTPEREQRRSDATDASGSVNLIVSRARQANVPVIHVPQRGSSLRSLAPDGGNDSKTISLTSPRQQLKRPTTAPEASTEYFDLPRHERRRISALIQSASAKSEGRVLKETQPAQDEQATKEITKVISVPSTSISSQGQQGQPQPVLHLSEPADPQNVTPDRYVTGEWSALRPQSALVTPFSLRSAHSSTPGTLEVNEATAISIYPHTNKSILVIQQMTGGDPNDPPGHSAIIAANANIALPATVAPTLIHETRQALNSPLKNPRAPPQPPDFKLIPPTPLNGPPTEESNSQQSPTSPTKIRLNRPVAMMKRALSARRYSESFVSPLSRSLSRQNTVNGRRPSVGDDPDSRLHPFWRPRGFWDDLSDSSSDSDSDFGNVPNYADVRVSRKNHLPDVSSSQPITRSTSLTRRFATSFSRKTSNNHSPYNYIRSHARSLSDGSQEPAPPRKKYSFASLDNNRSYEFLPQPARQRDGIPMPRLGYRVQFIGLKGLAEKMEKAKVRREEGRRERAREKLRGSIGVVRLGDSGLVSGGVHDLRR